MKIGIITYWDSQDNYGQLLQCYALQRYLRDLGHNPYLIRYKPENKSKFTFAKLTPKNIINYIKFLLNQHLKDNEVGVKRDFNSFRSKLCVSDRVYYGLSDLVAENWNDTDIFICGSDQIWSPKPLNELYVYYLKFTPFQKKRIAYAPSFGRQKLDSEYSNILPSLIGDFDSISVREASGVEIIKDVGFKAELVCDPTMLLSGQIYRNEFTPKTSSNSDSCFCYFINWNTDVDEEALIEFCKKTKLRPQLFCTKGYKSKIKPKELQSPESWLQSLMQSRFSAINSFHGLVFSILFHIPFAVYLLKGKQAAMNGRIHSLLKYIGLSNRIVANENSIEDVYSTPIDWEFVDTKIEILRELSFQFLKNAIKTTKHISNKLSHNICFLTSGSVHHFYGGLDRVTEILADRFEADGNNVFYLSAINRGKFNSNRQYFLPVNKNRCAIENSKYLTQFLRDNKIDILINQEGNVNMCIPFVGREKVKVFTCLHFNPNYIDDRHFFNKFSKTIFPIRSIAHVLFSIKLVNNIALKYLRNKLSDNYKTNLKWCDRFILLSSLFRKSLKELTGENSDLIKVESIYNPNNIDPEIRDDKENIILYVGRLDINFKRVDTLIDDVTVVLEDNPEWRMVICGDGPDREYLQNKVNKLTANIEFAGYCDPSEYYKKASVIVLRSSRSEGWGMVLIEAMSYGVIPVVAGTYDSLPDIIDNDLNGIITPDSHSEFSTSLKGLIRDKDKMMKMSLEAVKKSSSFSIDKIVNEWYRLFSI